MADPHDDLHNIAGTDSNHDQPVQVGDDDDWKAALAKVNKDLTKRINDMRTDNDAFQKAVSTSVKTVSDDVKSAKTAIQNNKDAITAQDELITEAGQKADGAKKAANDAATKADAVKKIADANTSKINDTAGKVTALGQEHDKLVREYGGHTHDLTVAFQGTTGRPKVGETE